MATIQIESRFNESKFQFTVQELPDATPPAAAGGTNMVILFKDFAAEFNQQELFGKYWKLIHAVREQNILNRIAAGEFGTANHILFSFDFTTGENTVAPVDGNIYGSAPVNSINIGIPNEAGWARDGSTTYLYNIAKRLHERLLESYLKFL